MFFLKNKREKTIFLKLINNKIDKVKILDKIKSNFIKSKNIKLVI